jgi:ATP-binding cassette subfamily F protein uup
VSNNIVSINGLSKAFPERPVLDDVSFGIDEGDRLGVIGFNGSGKSTLLSLVAGKLSPDAGDIVTRSGLTISYLEQAPEFEAHTTVSDVAARSHATLTVLHRLGLEADDRRIESLSGGQRRRLALAVALAEPCDLLILDEPTNHLDIDVIEWMEDELARRSQTLMFVTHDRYLLDRLANRIVEIDQQRIHHHAGNYQDYLEAREVRRELEERVDRRRRNLARTELEWLRRSPKARTSKSKARIDRATELQRSTLSEQAPELEFELPSRRLGDAVVDIEDASVAFGEHQVLAQVRWRLSPGARLGIVGPNGAGKTTLLRLFGDRLEPTTGTVKTGATVKSGWYGQDPERLDPDRRIVDVMRDEAEHTRLTSGVTVSASQLLERFGFRSRQHSSTVGDLSGGERRRLELLRVLVSAPNLLLLDEPTNDLDLETLGALEEQLDSWPGAVVAATHDRYFLERVCRDVVSVEPDGTIRHHPGGYAAYLAWRDRRSQDASGPQRSTDTPTDGAPEDRYDKRLSYNEQREYRRLERSIPQLSSRVAELDAELEDIGSDWERAEELSAQRARVAEELESAEHRWLELAERA